jgi:sorting nexin-1/2
MFCQDLVPYPQFTRYRNHLSNIHMQLIELWETFLFQLDSDEDGPPFLPSGLQAEQNQAHAQAQAQSQAQQSETSNSADDTEARKDAPASDDAEDSEANGAGVKAAGDDDAEGSLADSRLSEA